MNKIMVVLATLALLFAATASASAESNGFKQRNPANWVHKAAYTYVNETGESVPSGTWLQDCLDGQASRLRRWTPTSGRYVCSLTLVMFMVVTMLSFNTDRSLRVDRRVGDVNNLSFDIKASTNTGAGAPTNQCQLWLLVTLCT